MNLETASVRTRSVAVKQPRVVSVAFGCLRPPHIKQVNERISLDVRQCKHPGLEHIPGARTQGQPILAGCVLLENGDAPRLRVDHLHLRSVATLVGFHWRGQVCGPSCLNRMAWRRTPPLEQLAGAVIAVVSSSPNCASDVKTTVAVTPEGTWSPLTSSGQWSSTPQMPFDYSAFR